MIFTSNQTPFLDDLSSKGVPSGGLPRRFAPRNDIKYFVRNKIHSLKSQNFDGFLTFLGKF